MKVLLQDGTVIVESVEFEGEIVRHQETGVDLILLPDLRSMEMYPYNTKVKVIIEIIKD